MKIVELHSAELEKNWNGKIATARCSNCRACRLIDEKPCNCRNVNFRTDGGCPCTREEPGTHPIVIVAR